MSVDPTPLSAPGPSVLASEYMVLPTGCTMTHEDVLSYEIRIVRTPKNMWRAVRREKYLEPDGTWSHRTSASPEARASEFEDVVARATAVINDIKVNGLTFAETVVAYDTITEQASTALNEEN